MKSLPVFLCVIFLGCPWMRANGITDDPGHIKIGIVPYYDYRGPVIKLAHYAEGLASNDEKVVLATVAEMKKAWQKLTVSEMYVAAIRLYDLGYRKEGVYWFFSAEFRGYLFADLIDKDKMGGMGDPAFEVFEANDAFYQLSSPYFDGYAFGDTQWVAEMWRRVQKELLTIPDFKTMYPGMAFKDESQWKDIDNQLRDGMTKFIDHLGDKEAMKKGAAQRVKSGYDAAFSKLTNKDLPSQ